jgi:hypothetical protein
MNRAMNRGCLFPLALLACAGTVRADESFRCGKWIASSDMSVEELLAKCGTPTQRASSTEDVMARNQYGLMQKIGETTVMTWTYDRGATAPPMVVTIVDGRIKSIDRKK